MKRYYFIVLLLITAFSTTFSQQWVETYSYSNNTFKNGEDKAFAITVDGSGNIYQAGYVSFSLTLKHICVVKYNPAGVMVWAKTPFPAGSLEDKAYAITVDDLDNVYVTGYSLDSSGNANIVLIKLTTDGNTVWTKTYNGSGNGEDKAYAIKIDESDNVYIGGSTTVNNHGLDYIVLKYNSAGTMLWSKTYNGNGNDEDVITAMAIDGNNDPIATGYSRNTHNAGTEDIVTIKFNKSNGNVKWTNTYNGGLDDCPNLSDKAYAITVDDNDNIFVAGYITQHINHGTDAVAIKYTSGGDRSWVTSYNYEGANSDDIANSIVVTNNNNVVITGSSKRTPQAGSEDYLTIDIHAGNGNIKWVESYNGAGNASDIATCMALSSSKNEVFVSGYCQSGISSARYDIVTLKYKIANGDQLDSSCFNASGTDDSRPTGIIVTGNDNVIVGGYNAPKASVSTSLDKNIQCDFIAIGYIGGFHQSDKPVSSEKTETSTILYQNYPNPFNPVTSIKFYLPNSSSVRLTIYDMLGKEVSTLVNGNMEAGIHEVQFNGSNLSSGIYFYEININGLKDIKKMILAK